MSREDEAISNPSVLIIDDDPTHLRIYSWIIEAAGYRALPALVTSESIDFPAQSADIVMLDYHLVGQITAVEAANQLKQRFPKAPIIVLSDAFALPEDIAPLVQGFVRKGHPAKLVDTLAQYLNEAS